MRQRMGLVLALFVVSCSKSSSHGSSAPAAEQTATATQSSANAADAPVKSDSNGIVVATVDGSKDQKVTASSDAGSVAGATVVFPAGALAIATDVTVAEGTPLPLDTVEADLKLDPTTTLTAVSGTILITADAGATLSKPMQVTVPYNAPASLDGSSLVPTGEARRQCCGRRRSEKRHLRLKERSIFSTFVGRSKNFAMAERPSQRRTIKCRRDSVEGIQEIYQGALLHAQP